MRAPTAVSEHRAYAPSLRKEGTMKCFLKGARGIFTPDQVRKMQARMDEEAIQNESADEQEERAIRILQDEERSMGIVPN